MELSKTMIPDIYARVFEAAIRIGPSRTSMLDKVLDKGGTPAETVGLHLVREIVRRIGDRAGITEIWMSLEAAARMGLDINARNPEIETRGLER